MPGNPYKVPDRTVALLTQTGRPFGEALEQFLQDLGLTVILKSYPLDLSEIDDLLLWIEGQKQNQTFSVLVQALESDSVVNLLTSPSRSPIAQPLLIPAVASIMAYRAHGRAHTITVVQQDDPMQDESIGLELTRVEDTRESRLAFKASLANAGCLLGADFLRKDTPKSSFDHPNDWWSWEFDDPTGNPGYFTEFLVDASLNRKLTQSRMQDDAKEKIKTRQPLDLKYHYVGWRAARSWSALTQDPAYGHEAHVAKLKSWIPQIVACIESGQVYNYISLGPGDGRSDASMFPHFAAGLEFHSVYFVDVSTELLQLASNELIDSVLESTPSNGRPRLRAMLGDFEDSLNKLAPILLVSNVASLFMLTGFTLGNGNELQVLENLSRGMKSGDYLLLDARLHKLGSNKSEFKDSEKAELVKPYNTEALRSFAFGPVEEVSDYIVRLNDPDISIDLTPQAAGKGFISSVNGSINVHVECSGLYENADFCRKLGMASTKTWSRRRQEREKLRLATITFYDFQELRSALDASKVLRVVWDKNADDVGVFLLQRTAENW